MYTFDRAVSTYGGWIESKLQERNVANKQRYSVEDLLEGGIRDHVLPKTNSASFSTLQAVMGNKMKVGKPNG